MNHQSEWSIAWDATCVLIVGACIVAICLIGPSARGMKGAPATSESTPDADWDWALEDMEHGPPELSSPRAIQLAGRTMMSWFSPMEAARYRKERDVQIHDLPKLTDGDGRVIHRWLVRGTLELDRGSQRIAWMCAIGHWDSTFVSLGFEWRGAKGSQRSWIGSEMRDCLDRIARARLEKAMELGGSRERLQPIVDAFPFTGAEHKAQKRIRELEIGCRAEDLSKRLIRDSTSLPMLASNEHSPSTAH